MLLRIDYSSFFFEPQTTQGKQTTQTMKTGDTLIKKNLAQKFKDLGGSLG